MARINTAEQSGAGTIVLAQPQRPRMAAAALALSQAVYQETTLSFREAEAARIRVSHYNGCLLCNNFRVADGLSAMLQRMTSSELANDSKVRGEHPDAMFFSAIAEWRTSTLFSQRERLAIEYAERISEDPRDLPFDDDFWSRLKSAFDEAEIVDLTYSITTWIGTGRFVHVLGLDSGVCSTDPAMIMGKAA